MHIGPAKTITVRVHHHLVRRQHSQSVLLFLVRVRAMRAGLSTANSCWFLLRLCNLSTLIREWTALHAFPSLAFKDVLLSARPPVKDGKQALFIPQVGA